MRLRYRILTSKRNKKEFRAVASDIVDGMPVGRRGYDRAGSWVVGVLLALVETPTVVLESDGEADLLEVEQMLREGRMGPRDLVDPGTGWREAREFEPLVELCLEAERDAWARRALWAGATLTALGLVAWLTWTLW